MFSIPNIITLLNLFLGCCAVVCFLNGNYSEGIYFVLAAGIADFLDGMLARLLKAGSAIGKQLDSLADMVSFGLVPGVIFYQLLSFLFPEESSGGIRWLAAPGFLITLFSCLRLAKFNLDERQSENFLGLPTPASTIFSVGLLVIFQWEFQPWSSMVMHPFFLYGWILVISWLLISDIPMMGLKFKNLGWAGNEQRYFFLVLAIIELVWLKQASLSVIILSYILISMFSFWRSSQSRS